MKAVNSLKDGPRGNKLALVAGLALMAILLGFALLSVGCGGDDNGVSNSQLDDAAGGPGSSNLDDVAPAGGAEGGNITTGESQEDVMVDYTWDECMADMTFRYADEGAADKVCNSIREDYSDSSQADLATVLPTVEAKENVTAQQGGSNGGDNGGSNNGDNNGGNNNGGNNSGNDNGDNNGGNNNNGGNDGSGGGSSPGWGEIEIQVPDSGPPAP